MKNNFEISQSGLENINCKDLYKNKLERFITANKLRISVPKEEDYGAEEYKFIKNPENPNSLKLENPEFMNSFFESKGYGLVKPKNIINNGGTTLFVSAGVQLLDDVIFKEKTISERKIFVAQPVFRTQYIDSINEGFSTSFINIASEIVNPSVDDHFCAIGDWINMLRELGLKREKVTLKTREKEPQWGDKKFKESILMLYYDGLEIGDANYIYDIPQKTRSSLKISDIGFGLERIQWILKGGSYFDGKKVEDMCVFDHCKTMALLAGSGLKPSNKEHGYRLRQLSKRVMDTGKKSNDLLATLKDCYNYWKKWTFLTMPESGALEIINSENRRNSKNI